MPRQAPYRAASALRRCGLQFRGDTPLLARFPFGRGQRLAQLGGLALGLREPLTQPGNLVVQRLGGGQHRGIALPRQLGDFALRLRVRLAQPGDLDLRRLGSLCQLGDFLFPRGHLQGNRGILFERTVKRPLHLVEAAILGGDVVDLLAGGGVVAGALRQRVQRPDQRVLHLSKRLIIVPQLIVDDIGHDRVDVQLAFKRKRADKLAEFCKISSWSVKPGLVFEDADVVVLCVLEAIDDIGEPAELTDTRIEIVACVERAGDLRRVAQADDEFRIEPQLAEDLMPHRHQPRCPRILEAERSVTHPACEIGDDFPANLADLGVGPPGDRQAEIVMQRVISAVEMFEDSIVQIDDLPALPVALRVRLVDGDGVGHVDAESAQQMRTERGAAAMHAEHDHDRPPLSPRR